MKSRRIITGVLIGAAIGLGLEGLNTFFAFFVPPYLVILPAAAIIGGCMGAFVKAPTRARARRAQQDLECLPACCADFLTQLARKMRYRQKVRQDVQAELAAHFEDDLKDCLTEEQRQQRAGKLIDDFGDMKMLAVLMRRAKKRCRPLWRRVVTRTFQAACVLVMCAVFYVIWFSTGAPTISVDYLSMLNRMSKPDVRNEDNAWPHYAKAIDLYVSPTPATKELISCRRSRKERERAMQLKGLLLSHRQDIDRWLAGNQKHWDNLTAGQKAVVLTCVEHNYIPFFKKVHQVNNDWAVASFQRVVRHVVSCIADGADLTATLSAGIPPDSTDAEYPREELTRWLKERAVPPNFPQAVCVAALHEADKRYLNLPADISAPISQAEQEYIGSWIMQNEYAWAEYDTATRKSYCYRPYANDPNDKERSLWNVQLPHLRHLRDFAQLGSWRSRIDRENGRLDRSIESTLAVARAGRHWQGKGTIVEQLVGAAMNSRSCDEILKLADTRKLSAAQLADTHDRFSQIYAEGYPTMNMEGERLLIMDTIQRSFTDGGPGGGHLIPSRWAEYRDTDGPLDGELGLFATVNTAASIVHAGRDATTAMAEQLYGRLIRLAGMTPYQRKASGIRLPIETLFSMPRHRFTLIECLLPATGRVCELSYRSRMHYQATATILALERWRLDKNQYPMTLGELVAAGFIEKLPMDPYSDKPLHYKPVDGDFVLYSVGPNFEDDGGKLAIERGRPVRWGTEDAGDMVLWPPFRDGPG